MKRFVLLAVLLSCAVQAQGEFNGHQFVGIAGAERAAVLKRPDGSLQLVRVGDRVGEEALLVGFDGGHAVLETAGEWGPVTLFVALKDGRQQVTRMERRPLVNYDFNRGEVGTLSTESQ